MKRLFQTDGVLIAVVALLGGVAAMAALYFAFDSPPAPEGALPVEAAVNTAAPSEELPLYTLFVRNVPAPFLNPKSGQVLGYMFLDVAFEVAGEEARAKAEDSLDLLSASFSLALAARGAGKPEAPGVPDFERMAALFKAEADQALGEGAARRVTITQAGAEGGG